MNEKLDTLIKKAQKIYASQMEYYGFGRKTFKFETDANGKAIVYHIKGKFEDAVYQKKASKVWDEVREHFDISKNIYLGVLESSEELLNGFAAGYGGTVGDFGGTVLLPSCDYSFNKVAVTVHELGHSFGLSHDYRNNLKPWISLYTTEPMTTSYCAAQWLNVHRYFNSDKIKPNRQAITRLVKTIPTGKPNAVRFNFEIADPDGLQQVQFLIPEIKNSSFQKLADFKTVNGKKNPHLIYHHITNTKRYICMVKNYRQKRIFYQKKNSQLL